MRGTGGMRVRGLLGLPSIFIMIMLALATLGACAAQTGWQRDERRACDAEDPPRLCLLAGPDAQQVIRVGGAALVPGECAAGPRARGGSVDVQVEDGRSGRDGVRRLRVRRGETVMISAVGGDVVVHERRGCARAGK